MSSRRKKPRKPKCAGSNTGKLKSTEITWIRQDIRKSGRQRKKDKADELLRKAKEDVARRRAAIAEEFRTRRETTSAPAVPNTSAEAVRENPKLLERLNAEVEKRGCSIFLLAMSMSGLLGFALIVCGFNFVCEFLTH